LAVTIVAGGCALEPVTPNDEESHQSIWISHAAPFEGGITVNVDGQNYLIQSGETVEIPHPDEYGDLSVWECVWIDQIQGFECWWDDGYRVERGKRYKVIHTGKEWNLSIRPE